MKRLQVQIGTVRDELAATKLQMKEQLKQSTEREDRLKAELATARNEWNQQLVRLEHRVAAQQVRICQCQSSVSTVVCA